MASVRFSLPLDLAVGVARAESGFKPRGAEPRRGHRGMQGDAGPPSRPAGPSLRRPGGVEPRGPREGRPGGELLLAGYLGREKTVEGALTPYLGPSTGATRTAWRRSAPKRRKPWGAEGGSPTETPSLKPL